MLRSHQKALKSLASQNASTAGSMLPGDRDDPSPDEVIDTSLLFDRPKRVRDAAVESAALLSLAQALSSDPGSLAQRLVDAAQALTGAPSAGLSLTDQQDGQPVFRWIATTGEYARYQNGTMPREFSPCGEVLKRGQPLLMRQMRRVYSYVDALHAPPVEVLLVPFADNGELVGTIWVAAHDSDFKFDAEDLRIVQNLAFFASAVSGTIGLVRTLQQREAAQAQELAISERERLQLGRLLRQTPGFVALLDGPQHTLGIVNDSFQRLTGHRATVGQDLFDVLPELRGQGVDELLQRAYSTGEPQHGHDVTLTLTDARGARNIAIDFVYQPMLDTQGLVTGVLLQGHDMTERRDAVNALREADRRKDEFLAVLAHEIRTPLSSIRLAHQALVRLKPGQDERYERSLQIIARQSGLLTATVDDMMDMASVRAGKINLTLGQVSVADAITGALESCQSSLTGRRQRILVIVPESPVWVEADLRRLVQIFVNLIGNASKYSPSETTISVEVATSAASVLIQVVDQGVGIPAEVVPHIFELFMQAPAVERGAAGGLGIGLNLVARLVELHRGRITVQSTVGQGSRFSVELPRFSPSGF